MKFEIIINRFGSYNGSVLALCTYKRIDKKGMIYHWIKVFNEVWRFAFVEGKYQKVYRNRNKKTQWFMDKKSFEHRNEMRDDDKIYQG